MNDDTRPESPEATDPTERLLAQALHEEAAMVHTDPSGLHEIQRRTASDRSRSRRSWVYAGLGAAAATAAVIAGVAVATDNGSDRDHAGPASTGPSTSTGSVATQPTTLIYVGTTTHRLFVETHPAPPDDNAGVMNAMLSTTPDDPDYTSGWPAGVRVDALRETNGPVVVDLTGPADASLTADPTLGAGGGMLAIQALLYNGQLQPGESVSFTYNGQPLQTVLGVDLPVKVAAEDQVRAFIQISSPADGQTVSGPVKVTVLGNVFEGNVHWELLDSGGTKVDSGYATTSMGSWSEATIRLGTLDPGTYTIRCFELSPANGKLGQLDDKTFTVQ